MSTSQSISASRLFAPFRSKIQCHLWHCQIPFQDYCSEWHSELAVRGEEDWKAIVIIDGIGDDEILKVSQKIVSSKMLRKHCGVPHVTSEDLCRDPWDLEGTIFFRELEPNETKRSWLFISEKDPEDFGTMWQVCGRPITISAGCFCQKYFLQTDYIRDGGSFRLKRVTTSGERFNKALYWLTFHLAAKKDENNEEGEVTPVSEGKAAKRRHSDDTSGRKVGLDDNVDLTGHAVAQNTCDQRVHQLALDTVMRMKGFARLSAVYGGTYMLNKPDVKECILSASGLLSINGVKFLMGNGKLARTLIHTNVTKHLSFKAVDGSYAFVEGKVQKAPVTLMEAMKSNLMGIFEKRRAGKFLGYVQDYDENDDPKTHDIMDLTKLTTKDAKFCLDGNTIDFIAHSIALHTNGQHLHQPALDTVKKVYPQRPPFRQWCQALEDVQG